MREGGDGRTCKRGELKTIDRDAGGDQGSLTDRGGDLGRCGGCARCVVGQCDGHGERSVLSIGVTARSREGARAAGDRAGGGGAVAPVDRRGEIARDVRVVGIVEDGHRAAEGIPLDGGDGRLTGRCC